MPLGGFFGKKQNEAADQGPGSGDAPSEVVHESTYVRALADGPVVVATVLCEKVSDRESRVIEQELIATASGRGHRVVVDLSEVMLLTSSGIGMLVQVHKACADGKGCAVFAALSPEITETLRITRMDKLLTLVDDVETARAKARP